MITITQWGGGGPRAIFIHGFAADSQSWIANVPAVAEHAAAMGIDLPGHGASWAVNTADTLSAIADQIVEALGPGEPCHWVGHSVGGAIAALCAVRLETLSLSLVAPVGLGRSVSSGFVEQLTAVSDAAEATTLLQSMVSNKRLISDQIVQRLLLHLELPGVRETLTRMGSAIPCYGTIDPDLEKAVAALVSQNTPRQVFWGRHDTVNPLEPSDSESFGGEWHRLENCGHLPQIEHWKEYNDALNKFISNRR